jgi:hypothetical protein
VVTPSSGLYASGVVREILAPVNFIFDGFSGAATYIVAEHIDLSTLVEASFITRFHSGNFAGTGSISVFFKTQGWTPDDPTQPFIAAAGVLAPTATAGAKPNPTPPVVLLSSVTSGAGPLAMIQVVGNANGVCNALISIDLVAKGGTSVGNADGFDSFLGYAG